jgi:hypothetical protein
MSAMAIGDSTWPPARATSPLRPRRGCAGRRFDVADAMVALARTRHPGLVFRQGDAESLASAEPRRRWTSHRGPTSSASHATTSSRPCSVARASTASQSRRPHSDTRFRPPPSCGTACSAGRCAWPPWLSARRSRSRTGSGPSSTGSWPVTACRAVWRCRSRSSSPLAQAAPVSSTPRDPCLSDQREPSATRNRANAVHVVANWIQLIVK